MPSATRALLIFNPAAGRHRDRRAAQLQALADGLRAGSWKVEIAATGAESGAAHAVAQGLDSSCDVLVGCGGDGTLHQIVNALAGIGVDAGSPALAVAPPYGTANILAHTLGVPSDPRAAACWLLQAKPRLRALGHAVGPTGASYFLTIASVGYDAAIVRDLSPEAKARWGKLAYAARAAVAWKNYFPAPLELKAGDRSTRADGVLFGLTPFYAGRLRLGRPGPDGALELALNGAPHLLPIQGAYLLTRGLEHAPGVTRLPTGPLTITNPGLPLELDGEPAGTTPVTLSLAASAISVLS